LWVSLSQLGQMDEAVHHLRQETKFNPSFESHFRAARLLAEANRPRDALLELDLAEQLRPVSVATAIARGNFHMALGESGKAATSYSDAARRNPNSAVAWNNLGRALERLGIPDRAEKHYVRALEIDPNHTRAKTNLDRLRARMRAQSP
jgi:predicted Zn-dependent protease